MIFVIVKDDLYVKQKLAHARIRWNLIICPIAV